MRSLLKIVPVPPFSVFRVSVLGVRGCESGASGAEVSNVCNFDLSKLKWFIDGMFSNDALERASYGDSGANCNFWSIRSPSFFRVAVSEVCLNGKRGCGMSQDDILRWCHVEGSIIAVELCHGTCDGDERICFHVGVAIEWNELKRISGYSKHDGVVERAWMRYVADKSVIRCLKIRHERFDTARVWSDGCDGGNNESFLEWFVSNALNSVDHVVGSEESKESHGHSLRAFDDAKVYVEYNVSRTLLRIDGARRLQDSDACDGDRAWRVDVHDGDELLI